MTRVNTIMTQRAPFWLKLILLCWFFSLSSWGFAAQTPAELAAGQKTTEQLKENATTLTPSNDKEVIVGIHLNDVQAIDLKLHNYMMDFYIWFRWKDPNLDPATSMEFINHSDSWSTMQKNSYEKPETLADGTLYQVTHVQGKMSKKMDLHDYPFDQQIIRIVIEDNEHDIDALSYKVEGVTMNGELKLPGFLYQPPIFTQQTYTHQTTFGDPRSTNASTYSRLTFDLPISRPHVNAFMKNIVPILLAVVCCSLAFLLNPTLVDARFQIAVVSLLSIVALQMTSSQDLPTIEYMTLLDNLYVIGYFYCIFVVAALTMSTKIAHVHDGEPDKQAIKKAHRFDHIVGLIGVVGYLIATLWTMTPLFQNM